MDFLSAQLADLFVAIRRFDIKKVRKLVFMDVFSSQRNDENMSSSNIAAASASSKTSAMSFSVQAAQSQLLELFFTSYEFVAPPLSCVDIGTAVRAVSFPTTFSPIAVSDAPNYFSLLCEPPPLCLVGCPTQPATECQLPSHKSDSSTDALKEAVCCNDIRTVEALLNAKVSFKPKNWYDPSLLVLAAEHGYNDIVQALLNAGDDPNQGYTRLPLHIAAENGHLETVQRLLNSGAQLHAEEEGGQTALMRAAASGHLLIVQVLIDKGSNINAVCRGESALMLASKHGHRKVYEFLYPYVRARGMLVREQALQQQAILKTEAAHFQNELGTLFGRN